ncbi:hypothetical protein CPC08DRAFT_549836 [Agrocybe pediades]|nr:hypothetical protein CPC08DRAFT_549836 [Agrocybe pediades]
MSATDGFPFTVSQQKALISTNLNSTLLMQFLFGIYTGVFCAAVYFHETQTAFQNRIVSGTILALYIITMVVVACNWYFVNILLCLQGWTRESISVEALIASIPIADAIVTDIASVVSMLLADGLLVWRCYGACGRSVHTYLLPVGLLIIETALIVAVIVFDCLLSVLPNFPTDRTKAIGNRLTSAMFISVSATSLAATFIICRQIYLYTSPGTQSRRRYQNIIDTLVQSSALYTAVAVLEVVPGFIETNDPASTVKLMGAVNYAYCLSTIVAGLAPTLMVARFSVSTINDEIVDSTFELPPEFLAEDSDDSSGSASGNEPVANQPTNIGGGDIRNNLIAEGFDQTRENMCYNKENA